MGKKGANKQEELNIDDIMAQASQEKNKGKGDDKVIDLNKKDNDMNGASEGDNAPEPEITTIEANDIKVVKVALANLHDSKNNFFKELPEGKFQALKDSIRDVGLLTPIIVRPIVDKEDNYEILAGHNRVRALRELGSIEVPAQVVNVDDDKAMEIIVDTNIVQRTEFSPMELARAFQEKAKAIGNRKGQRTDLAGDGSLKGSTRDIVAEDISNITGQKVSGIKVERYLKLNNTLETIQEKVDKGEMPIKVGTALGYLDQDSQKAIVSAYGDKVIELKESDIKKVDKFIKERHKEALDKAKEAKKPEPVLKSVSAKEVKDILKVEEKPATKFTFKIDIPLEGEGAFPDDIAKALKDIMDDNDTDLLMNILKEFFKEEVA